MLKGDVYLDTATALGTVGLFADCGTFTTAESSVPFVPLTTSVGISLRSHGIRLDVGTVVNDIDKLQTKMHFCLDRGD